MKNNIKNADFQKIKLYEVTSQLKIIDWPEMSMLEYSMMKQENKNQSEIFPYLLYKYIKIYDGRSTIDFNNQQALISLSRCMMKVIFGIQWSIPMNNLCPRVPNRMNYLIWINRFLLSQIQYFNQSKENPNEKQYQKQHQKITGVDIGTGASLIYPLIGNKMFGWRFLATQIDQQSISNCQKLINQNKMQKQIKVIQIKNKQSFMLNNLLNQSDYKPITFFMCNPPFFDTDKNLNTHKNPLGTMTQSQYNTLGGQYQFFFQLYMQSFHFEYKNNNNVIPYFTMMIGLGKNFQEIRKFLQQQKREYGLLQMVRFGKLNQNNNSRFIVAWKVNYRALQKNKKNINKESLRYQ